MKDVLILSGILFVDNYKIRTTNYNNKRLFNQIILNLNNIQYLKNKSLSALNNTSHFSLNLSNSLPDFSHIFLVKLKAKLVSNSSVLTTYYYIQFYNIFKNLYFLSDIRFKSF